MDSCVYTYANQKGKKYENCNRHRGRRAFFFGNQDINSKIMTLNVFITMSCTAIEVGHPRGNFGCIETHVDGLFSKNKSETGFDDNYCTSFITDRL